MDQNVEPGATTAYWGIKGMDLTVRHKVTEAARKEGLFVGDWMNRYLPRLLADLGSESRRMPVPTVVQQPPAPPAAQLAEAPQSLSTIEDLRRTVELAQQLKQVSGKKLPRSITLAMERQLKALVGVPAGASKAPAEQDQA